VSGSRSNRGADNGSPIQGASAWPSSFTGPARYSPPFNAADATDDAAAPPTYGEPYAPYAEATADYADPYASEAYASDPYATDPYARDAYGNPTASYEGDPYYSAPAYVPSDYPAHQYDTFEHENYERDAHERDGYGQGNHGYEADGYGDAGYSDAGYSEAGYADAGYAYAEPELERERERGRTQVLTETRPPEARPTRLAGPEIPGPREPESPRTRAPQRRPTPRKISWAGRAVQGVVLASLLGGVTAYVAFEKTVNVSVDGSVRQIHSFASTVGAALASDNIGTGSHDMISPAPGASLADNSTITIRYGRPVDVTVNGAATRAWVHYSTVGSALQELGIRTQGARFVSATAATPIGRSGLSFSVFTMRHVTFLVDGKSDPMDTTAATVDQAMGQAGITLQNQDSASVSLTAVPVDGETISIMRITGTTEVKQVSIPYTVTKQDDPTSYVGATTVVTSGQNGVAQVTYATQIINGVKQAPKEISRTVTKQPVTEVEKVGTKALPTNVSSLNWAALAQCESGGNPKSVDASGSYYGLYQFSISTWDSLGGSGLPSNASASEQTTRAELLYQRSGAGQWPVCGHNLFS
jgi:resuscitation-promoting factor RpfB